MVGAWMKLLKGEEHDNEAFEAGFREMFKDIARYWRMKKLANFQCECLRERARLGGDWAIAGVLLTSSLRKIARLKKQYNSQSSTTQYDKRTLQDRARR